MCLPLRMVPFWALSKTQNAQVLLQINVQGLRIWTAAKVFCSVRIQNVGPDVT